MTKRINTKILLTVITLCTVMLLVLLNGCSNANKVTTEKAAVTTAPSTTLAGSSTPPKDSSNTNPPVQSTSPATTSTLLTGTSTTSDNGSTTSPTTSAAGDNTDNTTAPVTSAPEAKINYTVSVIDSNGDAVSDVIVKLFDESGAPMGMKVVVSGLATFALKPSTYTVQLDFVSADANFVYDTIPSLSEDSPSTSVTLYKALVGDSLYATSPATGVDKEYTAYYIDAGIHYSIATKDDRNYFLFVPTKAGTYYIDCVYDGEYKVGYYGSPFFVLSTNAADMDNTSVVLDVQESMLGGTWVIGVDIESSDSFLLSVTRKGDPKDLIANKPWIPYIETDFHDYYSVCANWELTGFTFFDVKDPSLSAVYSESDGYYHLNDKNGPVIYIPLGATLPYLNASFYDMCSVSRVGAVIFDDDGNFVTKESYNELFIQYGFNTVPLTQKLAHAVKSFGTKSLWWDFSTESHLFGTSFGDVVPGNEWLFTCGYFTGDTKISEVGTKDAPLILSSGGTHLRFNGNDEFYFRLNDTALSFEAATINTDIEISYNGKTYTADENGVISVAVYPGADTLVISSKSSDIDFVTLTLRMPEQNS